MKWLMLLGVICIAITGCNKELSYSYAFNINGVAYNANTYTATYHYNTTTLQWEFTGNYFIGNSADSNFVQIYFSGNQIISPGTYYTGVTNPYNTTCGFAYVKNRILYSSTSGILEITQIDTSGKKIKGNFQFAAAQANTADTLQITNGSFANQYKIQ
jgi:hypothetical protein